MNSCSPLQARPSRLSGAPYHKKTRRFIRRKVRQGQVDAQEARVLRRKNRRIRRRVRWDLAHGLDPLRDPKLGRMQKRERRLAKLFANIT